MCGSDEYKDKNNVPISIMRRWSSKKVEIPNSDHALTCIERNKDFQN